MLIIRIVIFFEPLSFKSTNLINEEKIDTINKPPVKIFLDHLL